MLDDLFDRAFGDVRRLCRQPDTPKEQPAHKKVTKPKEVASPKKPKSWQDEFSPLMGKQLFYRVAISTHDRQPTSAPADSLSPMVKAAEATFVAAFNEAWNHLPAFDQNRLLTYWQHPSELIKMESPLHPRPLIQIVDLGAWTPSYFAYAQFGFELNFPISLIACNADRLGYEIARALAMVYRFANRAYWGLVLSMMEEPMAQFEKSHPEISEAALDKKYAALEREHLKVYEEQVALLLRGWRIEEPSGSTPLVAEHRESRKV
jgi:hypothetical protein